MSQASSRPDRGSPGSNKTGAILSPSRIVLLVLLVVVGVVAYHEYQVRTPFEESRKDLYQQMPEDKTKESTLPAKDVPKFLHGSWDHSTPEADVDVYTWKGWIFSYEIRVTRWPDGYVHQVQIH